MGRAKKLCLALTKTHINTLTQVDILKIYKYNKKHNSERRSHFTSKELGNTGSNENKASIFAEYSIT